MTRARFQNLCALLALAVAGCRSPAPVPSAPGARRLALNEGYSLLYDVLSREKDVDMILIVKSEEDDVDALITRIAETCGRAAERLEGFAELDKSFRLDTSALPVIEENTRAAIESTQTKAHIFSSGWKFELILLLGQQDALSYVSHMAGILEEHEENPERKGFLQQISREAGKLHDAVIDIISSRYEPGSASNAAGARDG